MIFFVKIIHLFFLVYTIMIFARILGSWIPELQRWRIMYYVNVLVDPYLDFFRKIIPPIGMMDFSPIIAFFALRILEYLVLSLFI